MKNFAIRNPNILFRQELICLEQSIDRLAKGLLGGRIEHESMPDLLKIINELKPYYSPATLEKLEFALSNNMSDNGRELTESAITKQLKIFLEEARLIDPDLAEVQAFATNFFADKQPALVNKKAQSKSTFLLYLRDIALELVSFLQRPIVDSLNDFINLYYLKHSEVADKAAIFALNKHEIKAANDFLQVSATIVLLQKVEKVADDYIKSGTDINMANGRIWASRYNRYDYVPFFFKDLAELEARYPFTFSKKELLDRLNSIRVKIKAGSLSDLSASKSDSVKLIGADIRLLEIKLLFGLVLNFTFSNWQQWVTILLQILDVKSIEALEAEQSLPQNVRQKLARVRYHINLYSVLYHDAFFKSKNIKSIDSQKETVLASALLDSDKIFSKLKFELELIGLSNLELGVEGLKHGKLEGLSEWVSAIINKESNYFKYRIAYELGLHEQAYDLYSKYLLALLGSEQSDNFRKLSSYTKVNSRNGVQEDSFWFSSKAAVFDQSFIKELTDRIRFSEDRGLAFFRALPILTRLAAEFGDFDKGLSLMIAQRHLWYEFLNHKLIPASLEPLIDVIDAEVRFTYGFRKAGATAPQLSAVKLLSEQQPVIQPLSETKSVFDKLTQDMLQDAIYAQYVSTQIRCIREYARLVKSRSYARTLAALVRRTVELRLTIRQSDFKKVSKLFSSDCKVQNADGKTLLIAKELESRAIAATKMLLDCSLLCAELKENKISREMIEFCLESYSQILPGLAALVSWVLSANSIEEFRRRIEKAISIIQDESESDYICLSAANSGVLLAFIEEQNQQGVTIKDCLEGCAELLKLVSAIRRRRIIAGRCGVLERYQDSYHAVQRQRIFCSTFLSLNDRLSTL